MTIIEHTTEYTVFERGDMTA